MFDHFLTQNVVGRYELIQVNSIFKSPLDENGLLHSLLSSKVTEKYAHEFRRWLLSLTDHSLRMMKFEHTLWLHLRGLSRSAIIVAANQDRSIMKIRSFDSMKEEAISKVKLETE